MTEQEPNPTTTALFKPLPLGNLSLSSRLVLAPLTRFRADENHTPLPMVAKYYAQRGSVPGTLLITEATFISPNGAGYGNIPGIWDPAHIQGWQAVTSAVHAQGSHIFCQLWALGRAAQPDTLRAEFGLDVVAPSAVPMPASKRVEAPASPRPLEESEIWGFVEAYAQAARNAIAAGFDGVEIHGANGYLVDQFTQDVTNTRTDAWGGSVERRARFAIEVAKAVVAAVGKERVGLRMSPWSPFQGMKMEDPVPTFTYLAKELGALGLAYLHVTESRVAGGLDNEDKASAAEKINFVVDAWRAGGAGERPVLLAGGFDAAKAARCVDEEYKGRNVAIVFGRLFISNPDLVFRLREGLELSRYNRDTFYKVMSEEGYTDYPFSQEFNKATEQKILA